MAPILRAFECQPKPARHPRSRLRAAGSLGSTRRVHGGDSRRRFTRPSNHQRRKKGCLRHRPLLRTRVHEQQLSRRLRYVFRPGAPCGDGTSAGRGHPRIVRKSPLRVESSPPRRQSHRRVDVCPSVSQRAPAGYRRTPPRRHPRLGLHPLPDDRLDTRHPEKPTGPAKGQRYRFSYP